MSTPRDFTLGLVANEPQTLYATGRFVGIIEAPSAALDVEIDGSPALLRGAGGSILLRESFKRVRFTSTATQTIRVLIADEVQDVSNIVTTGGGLAITVTDTPSSTLASPAAVTFATATASSIAANAARRRIHISTDPGNAAEIYIQATGAGAGRGTPLAAGMTLTLATTAAIDVRNDTGANATYSTLEESGP